MPLPDVLYPIRDDASAALRGGIPSRIGVTMLGGFSVSVDGQAIDGRSWKRRHPRLLWQMLCLAPGHRVSRDEAAEALWPQAGVAVSSNRLHHTLHTLRGILAQAGRRASRPLIELQAGTLWIDERAQLDLDVQRFRQAAVAARACNGSDAAIAHLEQACALHGGALALPAGAGDWFAPYRQALQREQVWVLEQLAQRHRAAGRTEQAVRAGQALVQAEPANEAAHRRLIELYEAQGRPELAAQQYTACSRYMRRDLGLQPSAATLQMVQRISEQARQQAAPAGAGASAPPHYVAPPRATPLLGREAELAELQQWLVQDEGPRLITIGAAGGIGKTRLAAALAEQVQGHFAHGVCFVALGEVARPSRLAERICRALGLPTQDQAAEQVLPQALATRHVLLVLDRFEHLVEAGPQLLDWLQSAPRLRIVVTSQRSLKLRAERVYELPSLWARAPQAAIELFVRTAARTGASLHGPHDEPQIRCVCERVGGNALAIELAAAQLAHVPLSDLPDALQQPLQLLVGSPPGDEPQHASLNATISWSVSLLAPAEARLLVMTSVFAGDFSADDVQAVLGPFADVPTLQPLLRTLLERHLLFRRNDATGRQAGRFALEDAVRSHGQRAAMALPQWAQVQSSHAERFTRVAAEAADLLQAGHGGLAYDIYRTAVTEFEQALRWLRERAQGLSYLRACWKVGGLHAAFGALREAMECLEAATTTAAQGREACDQMAWCHYMLSRVFGIFGDATAAVHHIRTARRLAKGSHDARLLGVIGTTLAMLRCTQLQVGQAIPLVEAVIRDSRQRGAIDQMSGQYNMLSACLATRGDYPGAAAACDNALDCALASNNPQAMLWALVGAAEIDVFRGHLDRAQTSLDEAQLLRAAGYSVASELQVALLAFYVVFEQGEFDSTAGPLEDALAVCRGALAPKAIMVSIAREFVLMETWRFSQAKILRRLDDQQLPFDADFSSLYVAAHCYGLFLQSIDSDWDAAADNVVRLCRLVRRSGNAMWAAWVAQAAAMAAHCVRRGKLARRLFAQSRELLCSRGLTPSARQLGTWRSAGMFLRLSPRIILLAGARCSTVAAAGPLVSLLDQLPCDLDRWCTQRPAPQPPAHHRQLQITSSDSSSPDCARTVSLRAMR
jgi:DNA-binding SARP family transcriptional activator/predicted ATPase